MALVTRVYALPWSATDRRAIFVLCLRDVVTRGTSFYCNHTFMHKMWKITDLWEDRIHLPHIYWPYCDEVWLLLTYPVSRDRFLMTENESVSETSDGLKNSKRLSTRTLFCRVLYISLLCFPVGFKCHTHTHTHTHIYVCMYIYVCVCVCVCVRARVCIKGKGVP